MHLYDKPVTNDREGITLAEDDDSYYEAVRMLFNWRLVVTPKSAVGVYSYGWCYDGPAPIAAALKVWDPETQNEPLGWKKRPATQLIRVAPRAGENPEYNRPRCDHGGYPDTGRCVTDPYCKGAEPLPDPAEAAALHQALLADLGAYVGTLRRLYP